MTEQELKDSTNSIAKFAVEIIDAKNAEIARLRAGFEDIISVIEGVEEHPDYDLSEQEAIYAKNVAIKTLRGGQND